MAETMDADSLSRQIVVRHRGRGHVRFGLPSFLCEAPHADTIRAKLAQCPGVYRVTLYPGEAKLSIYYDEYACGLADVARTLHAALTAPATALRRQAHADSLARRLHLGRPLRWMQTRYEALRQRGTQLKNQARLVAVIARHQVESQPLLKNALSEQAIINFLNDLAAFYLVKVHWEQISQHWLKQPFKYRYAWMTTFYLVFHLVRYRKQIAQRK